MRLRFWVIIYIFYSCLTCPHQGLAQETTKPVSGGLLKSPFNVEGTGPGITFTEPSMLSASLQAEIEQKGFATIHIEFDTGQYSLKPEHLPTIDSITELLQKNPSWNLQIEGHTDNQGTARRNIELSQRRAKTIQDGLVAKGIATGRLESAGFGQEKPVADNNTETGRAQNRRVELHKK
jgi:outer membrane protein OmpA-like peptidoglycan-associated protein